MRGLRSLRGLRGMVAVAGMTLAATAGAEIKIDRGEWKVTFEEKGAALRLENAAKKVSLSGVVKFGSGEAEWTVVEPRDAARDRLSLVSPSGTVLGYVSFRNCGAKLEMTVLHRAGANFFPGELIFTGVAKVREDSFACRTVPEEGEEVLRFADGVGDSEMNDSIFAREEDLAVRFFSTDTRLTTKGRGEYEFSLMADIDSPALCTMAVEADGAYYASRWVPAYHPINRKRCPKAPTGWMSWNIYFDKAGSAENLAEARIGAKYLKPFGLDIWSIESWQDNSLWLPVRHFHHHENRCYPVQFPEGMKALADEIRKLGFRPGIWMSLYGEGDQAFYEAHKDLYIHDAKGRPIDNWAGKYMLDTTKPEALALMTKLARQAKDEWGYEFFKFDGMANTPRKFERPEVRAAAKNPKDVKWFENSVKALREGIGEDSLFLACMGDFTGTEIQFADATRLGSDVVGCSSGGCGDNYNANGNSPWYQYPVKWKNVLHQAECTFTQIFINNIIAYTDPDTLMVGYALEENEAQVMATIVGLPGQLMFDGDKLGSIGYDRMKIIQQVLPVADIHPQNLYPYAASAMLPVWDLTVTRPYDTWHVVALFNWADEPKEYELPLADLGLGGDDKRYIAYEFWKQQYLGEVEGNLEIRVPMRSVRLVALRQALGRPQFVGDDRHVTQGAVEIADLDWNDAVKKYSMKVNAIAGFPFTYYVRRPEGFELQSAKVDGAEVKTGTKGEELIAVTVESKTTKTVTVELQF